MFNTRKLQTLAAVSAVAVVASPITAGPAFAEDGFALQVGGAAVIRPKYEGSKEYEVTGFPIVAPAGVGDDGVVQFRGIDDIRFRVLRFGAFEAGPLAGYNFGRDEDDDDRLTGLGDVDDGLVIGAYAAYDLGITKPFISYHYQVTGADGGLVRFGTESQFHITPDIRVTAIGGATWADSDYNDSYFSVATPTAFIGAFDADSGIKDVYFQLSSDIPLSRDWSLKLAGQYSHLLGDASDSTIVETDDQFTGIVGLTYRFDVRR